VIISFDIDGVIAATTDADFNPNRTSLDYLEKPLHEKLDLKCLNYLIAMYQTYFITARSFAGALTSTRSWLRSRGVNLDDSMGVIAAEGSPRGHDSTASDTKHQVVKWVGSSLHFDDHTTVVKNLPCVGVLVHNPCYEPNDILFNSDSPGLMKVLDWDEIRALCRTRFVERGRV
jgi:hypothetical protein